MAATTRSPATTTWWTSASTSMVGRQVSPPSSERTMPPTCTFT
ncbi:MAG: hypothetical protein ACLGI2_12045 [Acidimicrobiia bacterium]